MIILTAAVAKDRYHNYVCLRQEGLLMRVGGIILCGGKSERMGYPKALLPFGDEVMLQRVVRLLSEVVSPLVVVAAADQSLPPCPGVAAVVRDERPERGPLEGLCAGLKAMLPFADAAYVTSVDVPLLAPAFVRQMIGELGAAAIAVPFEPRDGKTMFHPLAGVYRTSVLPEIEKLLAADRLRVSLLFEQVSCQRVPVEKLRAVDPCLDSLRNINFRDEYVAVLHEAGLTLPTLPPLAERDPS